MPVALNDSTPQVQIPQRTRRAPYKPGPTIQTTEILQLHNNRGVPASVGAEMMPAWLLASAVVAAPALGRRALCLAGTCAITALPMSSAGSPDIAGGATSASITDRVRLEFVQQISAEESLVLPITIGLFGEDAPESVNIFKGLCAGALAAPCPVDVDMSAEVMERGKQSKKAALRACVGSEDTPVGYAYSTVWSIQRGKRIDAGAVQGKFALRVAPTTSLSESAALSHDAAGLLSVRRGGGTFDFAITSAPTPEYDADNIVIGRVVDGMQSVAALDAMPVVKAADAFNIDGPRVSRASACEYSNPQPFCAQNKPLKKILLLKAAVL